MNVDHLLNSALVLANSNQSRPRRTDLRRACSNIYYAMFHALCEIVADQLAGRTRRQSTAWVIFYRLLNHGEIKNVFAQNSVRSLSPEIAGFAIRFNEMQKVRHTADYDPTAFTITRNEVNAYKREAEIAITDLRAVDPNLLLDLVAHLLQKSRH